MCFLPKILFLISNEIANLLLRSGRQLSCKDWGGSAYMPPTAPYTSKRNLKRFLLQNRTTQNQNCCSFYLQTLLEKQNPEAKSHKSRLLLGVISFCTTPTFSELNSSIFNHICPKKVNKITFNLQIYLFLIVKSIVFSLFVTRISECFVFQQHSCEFI